MNRSDLAALVPLDGPVAAKTFVIEVRTDDPAAYLTDLAENAGPITRQVSNLQVRFGSALQLSQPSLHGAAPLAAVSVALTSPPL